ncbi:MAG: glutamine synthetase family protein [Pseudomonadota bacterium]
MNGETAGPAEATLEAALEWLRANGIERIETTVPDMAGIGRGKVQPVSQFKQTGTRIPYAILAQTVNSTFHLGKDNVGDRDMSLRADLSTIRRIPWTSEPSAVVIMDCIDDDGNLIGAAPRAALARILSLYEQEGWTPVVAPEVEFYIAPANEDPWTRTRAMAQDEDDLEDLIDPYGTDRFHELSGFFSELEETCRKQDIETGALSQELGPGQFEVNFDHGDPMKLADDVFHFKRAIRHVAANHDLRAIFLSKVHEDAAGSAFHIHQSVYGRDGNNAFSGPDGEANERFGHYIGGLQRYLREFLLLFAPYPNSYRRLNSHWASPINLEWGIDNRTVGLRVPVANAQARRVENRLAGADVNPYLAIAGSLACGYLGMQQQIAASAPVDKSAYDAPFALLRHPHYAIGSLRQSKEAVEVFGEEFVTLFAGMKEHECLEFEERVPVWERELLGWTI